ncbi:MAG: hypothetical protein LBQ73_05740 [Tannerellaceae bacterium]|jgi:hypothetical protein|nr:hypothetical protein [Tannerellaceae bacterium]
MKEKIFTALKAAILVNGKTSISDKTLNTYVDVVSAQITDETQITEAIKPHVVVLKEIQGNINSVASESATVVKTEYEKRIEDLKKANPANPANPPKEEDEFVKKMEDLLSAKLSPLQEKLSAYEAQETQKTLSSKLTELLKSHEIPEWYSKNAVSGRTFKDETEVTAFAETLKTEWGATKQELVNQGFTSVKPPVEGGGTPDEGAAVAALIAKGTEEIVKQQTKN